MSQNTKIFFYFPRFAHIFGQPLTVKIRFKTVNVYLHVDSSRKRSKFFNKQSWRVRNCRLSLGKAKQPESNFFFKTVKHNHTLIYQLLKEVILGSCQIIKFSLFLFGIYFVHILIKYVYFESIKKNFKRCSLIKM